MTYSNEQLVSMIQDGQKGNIQLLWEQVERFVKLYAYRFYNGYGQLCSSAGVTADDLIQEYYLAMCKAAENYKPDRDSSFINYLMYYLKTATRKATGCRTAKIDPLNTCGSLDEPLSDDTEDTLAELIADPAASEPFENVEDDIFYSELVRAVHEALNRVDERQRKVCVMCTVDGATYSEAARKFNISSERIRQLNNKALKTIRTDSRLLTFIDPDRCYRQKSLSAFRSSGTSVVEDIVEQSVD